MEFPRSSLGISARFARAGCSVSTSDADQSGRADEPAGEGKASGATEADGAFSGTESQKWSTILSRSLVVGTHTWTDKAANFD